MEKSKEYFRSAEAATLCPPAAAEERGSGMLGTFVDNFRFFSYYGLERPVFIRRSGFFQVLTRREVF
jgi:hypothetical protein